MYTLPVIYALRESPELREMLGRPIDSEHLGTVRTIATSNGAVDASLGVARDHAVKACDALDGAEGLDADVCAELSRLVDGLVTRER